MRHLALLLLCAACAHASRSKDPQAWSELQSEHFVLRTDLDLEDARRAIADLEQTRAALRGTGWHAAAEQPGRTVVIELANDRELHEFTSDALGGFVAFDAFGEPIMVVSAEESIVDQEVVKHELTHVMTDGLLLSKPRWVSEGLACYLETMKVDRDRHSARIGGASWDRDHFLRRQEPDPYGTMAVGRDAQTMGQFSGYLFESRAWLLVHWMIDERPKQFAKLLERLARGDNAWVAFTAAFPDQEPRELISAVDKYRRVERYPSRTVQFTGWNGAIAVNKLGAAQVLALRADLFRLSPGDTDPQASRSHMISEARQALAIDPGEPVALALLKDSDAARAVAAHPNDWRAWVLAYDRSQSDRASILKAAELAPDNAVVLTRLAFSDESAGKLQAALVHATRAAQLAPGRSAPLDALALALAANHRCTDAVDAEQRAIDAVPDSASDGTPKELRRRMHVIQNQCTDK